MTKTGKDLGVPRSSAAHAGLEAGTPRQNKGWYKHGNLPHYDAGNAYQSITYRLADSLPKAKLDELAEELRNVDPKYMEAERRKQIEKWLDAGYGSCALRNPDHAGLVIDTWKYFDGERYDLIAWVVMPNHAHVLARFREWPMGKILNSWKSYTARRIDLRISHPGAKNNSPEAGSPKGKPKVWKDGYWDRYMRNELHFYNTIAYIENNPVSAGLVKRAEDWPFSSAGERICRAGARQSQVGAPQSQVSRARSKDFH